MSQLSQTPLAASANLKAYYKLENVNDSSGGGFTLTNNNSVTFTAAKFANGANQGTGNTNKSLSIANNLGIAGNGSISIVFWIKLIDEIASGTWTLIRHASTTTADRYMDLNYFFNSGAIRMAIDAAGSTPVYYTAALGTTLFHHIAMVRDVPNTSAFLYVDGVLRATETIGSTTSGFDEVYIGAAHAGVSVPSALFDDCAFFNRVLTAGEIQSLYNSGGGFFLAA